MKTAISSSDILYLRLMTFLLIDQRAQEASTTPNDILFREIIQVSDST
jgi:hypothetical protein